MNWVIDELDLLIKKGWTGEEGIFNVILIKEDRE